MTTELPDSHRTPPAEVPLALKLNEGLGVNVVTFKQALTRRFKKGTAFVVDDGSATYLDGIECRYAVYVSTGVKAGEWRIAGYVFDRADALKLAGALTPNVRANRPDTAAQE